MINQKQKLRNVLSAIAGVVLILVPFVFVEVLGWKKVFFRIVTVFLMVIVVIAFFAYGSLMRYPNVYEVGEYPKGQQQNIIEKRKFLGPLVRIFLLGLSIFIFWGFAPFFNDLFLIVSGVDNDYVNVVGQVTDVQTLWGSAPFYQSIQLNGDTHNDYVYFYSFHRPLAPGDNYEFLVLRNSKFIVDDKRTGGSSTH